VPGRPARGRPARRFRLPEQASCPAHEHLLAALLAEFYDSLPPPEQQACFRRLAASMAAGPAAGPDPAPLLPAAGLSQRLGFAVQRLNQLGYQARWEAHASGPRLILEQRPFATLESSLPQLAKLETFLLEQLLGTPLSRIEVICPAAQF
jgi:predicted ArsR family transcriptional regulator